MTSYFAPLCTTNLEPLKLDMQSIFLSGQVLPFGAKLSVSHIFRSSEETNVEVVYCFPLSRAASLVSFEITGKNFRVSSSLEPRSEAEKRYEEGLANGSLAVITEQNADGMVNLTVGNLRPGETVSVRLELVAGVSLSDNGLRLRFPFTVAPCYHPQMRVSTDGGVGTLELPDDITSGAFLPPFHADPSHLHQVGFRLQIGPKEGIREVSSPSHAIRMSLGESGNVGVSLSPDRDVPNRDLILDVQRDFSGGRAWFDAPSQGRKHFALVAPSSVFGQPTQTKRRVVFLLDRSGSMADLPMAQARLAIESCLAKLSSGDQFGIVAFDDQVEAFSKTLSLANRDNLEGAIAFLSAIDARGGTDLANGVDAATELLRSQGSEAGPGEIFLITDGQVSGTVEILRRARKCGVRLFCLGIGTASQDRFLDLLARQTGGVCRFVSPSEQMEIACSQLFASIGGAIAKDVRIANATVYPDKAETVFSGSPFVAFGDLDSQVTHVQLQWAGDSRSIAAESLDEQAKGLLSYLLGARRIADLEAADSDEITPKQLLALSKQYGLSSSEMSLVAVVERADDQAGELPKTKIVPVGMPEHTSFDSYFGGGKSKNFSVGTSALFSRTLQPGAPRPAQPLAAAVFGASFKPREFSAPLHPVDAVVRKATTLVEDRASLRHRRDSHQAIELLLRELVDAEDQVKPDKQKAALKALIEFISSCIIDFLENSQFDALGWIVLRAQLTTAWPELVPVEDAL